MIIHYIQKNLSINIYNYIYVFFKNYNTKVHHNTLPDFKMLYNYTYSQKGCGLPVKVRDELTEGQT
jgi:hypothetical protein